jgi:hypothetical protein
MEPVPRKAKKAWSSFVFLFHEKYISLWGSQVPPKIKHADEKGETLLFRGMDTL